MSARPFRSSRHEALSTRWPSCDGPCDQGRKACPTREACRVAGRSVPSTNVPVQVSGPFRKRRRRSDRAVALRMLLVAAAVLAALLVPHWLFR